jgi:uncharacterized damage-inducible protein DinB
MAYIDIPGADEYAPYYGKYLAKLPQGDVMVTLETLARATARLLAATDESRGAFRYAEGKWSVKGVVGHLIDCERVFAYRALRFGRGDATELAGFEENDYVPEGRFNERTLVDLAAELTAVRVSTLALFRGFSAEALLRRGVANGNPMSVRALAANIAGHELHHVTLLRERYGLSD